MLLVVANVDPSTSLEPEDDDIHRKMGCSLLPLPLQVQTSPRRAAVEVEATLDGVSISIRDAMRCTMGVAGVRERKEQGRLKRLGRVGA